MKNIFNKWFMGKDFNKLNENVEIGYKVIKMREIINRIETEVDEIKTPIPACKECKWYKRSEGEVSYSSWCMRPTGNREVQKDFENGVLKGVKEVVYNDCCSERINMGLRDKNNPESCDVYCGQSGYFFKAKNVTE